LTPFQPSPSNPQYTQFHNKRLCERWLDNLFMVLYEDLRIYTIWRTDIARAKSEDTTGEYRKSAEEWEILGELAERLHHFPEAVEAYQACLRVRFSPKAMRGVLGMYESQGRVGEVLQAAIRLIAWQYRWYSEVCWIVSGATILIGRLLINGTSFPQPSSKRYAISSKAKVQSKSAVSSRPRAYPSLSWTSLIAT